MWRNIDIETDKCEKLFSGKGNGGSSMGPSEDNCKGACVCAEGAGFTRCHIDYISETCLDHLAPT